MFVAFASRFNFVDGLLFDEVLWLTGKSVVMYERLHERVSFCDTISLAA